MNPLDIKNDAWLLLEAIRKIGEEANAESVETLFVILEDQTHKKIVSATKWALKQIAEAHDGDVKEKVAAGLVLHKLSEGA